MAVVISPSLVLVNAGDFTPDNPLVGYHNVVVPGVLTADYANSNYPVSNLANPSTVLPWKSTGTATQYVTVSVSYTDPIDYLAIARHNPGSSGAIVSVEANLGAGFTEVVPGVILGDDSPALFRFSPVSVTAVRLKITTPTAIPQIAVMYVGKLLVLQRRIYVGHTPVKYGRTANVVNGMSESGDFLGRIVLSERLSTSFTHQNMTPDWYRANMDPWILDSQENPFFFAWRPSSYPREIGFCWMTNSPMPQNQLANGLMQISFQVAGVIS